MTAADPGRFLATARERRKVMMRSTCRITRPAGEPVFDRADGTYATPAPSVVYEGVCQVKPTFSPAERADDVGEGELTIQSYDVVVPQDAPRVLVGDSAEVLASDDSWAVDRGLMPVAWVELADSRTARHITVFAQNRPGVT